MKTRRSKGAIDGCAFGGHGFILGDLIADNARHDIDLDRWDLHCRRELMTIHGLFEAQVERTPDQPAVVSNGEQLSYAELNRRANRVGHRLRELSVGPEVPVAICVNRSLDAIAGLLGILKAGGVVTQFA